MSFFGRRSDVPSAQSRDVAIMDWCTEAIKEGEAFLRSQSGYEKIGDIMSAIMGDPLKDDLLRPASISNLRINHIGKTALDLSSALTDVKPFWEYKTSNPKYELQADNGQKLASAWWLNRQIDLKFCDGIKFALAAGSVPFSLDWRPDIQDQDLIPDDPRDVLPIRPNNNWSFQDCFGVIKRRERTVNSLRAQYPDKASAIKADRDMSLQGKQNNRQARIMEAMGTSSGFMNNLFNSMGGRPAGGTLTSPVCDLFTVYVNDDSINQTKDPIVMGEPMANWSYIVQPGEALYPRKRCIVMTRSCKLYDGPSIYWHGLFPVSKLTLDPWPWSWMGKSPLKDLLPIAAEVDRIARGIADKFEQYWRPGVSGDKNSISQKLMDKLDTRRAGVKIRTNPVAGQGIALLSPDMSGLGPAQMWLTFLIEKIKELSGTQELTSLAQLNQLPSTETIERMMEAMSPAVRLRSRVMEAFLREMAMMVLMNFFQFYTKAQRVAILGPNGLTFEDFDYDPETMIPDMIQEMGRGSDGNPLPRMQRAQEFIRMFTYQVAPGSLLSASEVTNKLLYMQLSKMGFVDAITLLDKLGINNVGAPPEAGQTIMERLQWQQSVGLGMAAGPQGASAAGRKATNQTMPRMVMKTS